MILHRRQNRAGRHVHPGAADDVIDAGRAVLAFARQGHRCAIQPLIFGCRCPVAGRHGNCVGGAPGRFRRRGAAHCLDVLAMQPGQKADTAVGHVFAFGRHRRAQQGLLHRQRRRLQRDAPRHHGARQRLQQLGQNLFEGICGLCAHTLDDTWPVPDRHPGHTQHLCDPTVKAFGRIWDFFPAL